MTAESTASVGATNPARLSVAHVGLLLPWITAVVAARLSIRDNSFLWHVTAGRLQIEGGSVITADPFSFTYLGESWRTQSWLLELGYGFFDDLGGLSFVTPFIVATASVMFALVMLVTFRQTGSLASVVIIGVLSAWLSAAFLSPRPVLVSYLLLALVVAACTDNRLRWTLPLIAFLWAALHGSFILGIGYVVLVGLSRRDGRALIDAAVMALVSTFTAHGFGVWQVLLEFGGSQDALALITEWATPDFTRVALVPFLIGILLLIVAGIRGGLTMRHLWVGVPFLVFATTATRAVFPAWIALAPLAGLAMQSLRVSSRSGRREVRVLSAIAVALVAFPFVLPIDGSSTLSEDFPIEASEALSAERVFHDDYAGGYLIYRYGPERLVFVDDRAELYGAEHLQAMVRARSGVPQWRDVFDEWEIRQALIGSETGLAAALADAGWRTDYEDESFVVMSSPG